MKRREFLKVIPLAAIAPKVVTDGVMSVELPAKVHLLFIVDASKMLDDKWIHNPNVMPPGATGGAIVYVHGNPDEVMQIYQLDKK